MTDETRPTEPVRAASTGSPFAAPTGASGGQPFAGDPFGGFPGTPPPAAAPVVVPATKSRSTAGVFVNVLLGVALVVAVGGVAFAAGRATAPTTTGTDRFGANAPGGGNFVFGPGASGAPTRGGFGGALGGGGITIEGTVTAVSADSITVQLASGQSITIPTTSDTTYHSQTAATSSDVTSGATVKVELSGGRLGGGQNGGQGGNGNGGQSGPAASGAPTTTRGLGAASSITVVPAGG